MRMMKDMREAKQLLSAEELSVSLESLARAIFDRYFDKPLALVGLLSRGDIIARRLAVCLKELGLVVELGHLDISLYRDDLGMGKNPMLRSSDLSFSVDDMNILLIDDVLYTGRTIKAALNAVMDYGRPKSVGLAVLVDRGGREMPIQPDFIGVVSPVPGAEISVLLTEMDGKDEVIFA